MSAHRLLPVVFALLLAACVSSGDKRPDWVEGTAANYPNAKYLVGRGQAPSAEQAQDRARADLAKNFEVAVRVESEDTQRYESGAGYQAQVSRVTATAADQIIQGIQIAERWRDPKTGGHHALAVLPRGAAVLRLREETDRLDAAISSYIQQARTQDDVLAQIGAASRALALSQERAALQKSLRVVDITGRGAEPQWSSAKLTADLDGLLKRVRIATRTSSDPAFAEILAGSVAAAGFSPALEPAGIFLLDGELALGEPERQEGWYWSRGTLNVRLIDPSGRVRGTHSWTIKAAGQIPAAARERALQEATSILKKELRATLVNFTTQ